MHAKFYIVDCQWHCHEVSLATKSHGYQCTALDAAAEEQITSSFRTNTIVLDGAELLLSNAHQFFSYNYVHPIQMYYLLKELEHWQRLRQKIVRFLRKLNGIVVLKVIPVDKGVLDLAWCRRATALTWRKVEEENLMSWLSTLGGAFSALGDCFQKCVREISTPHWPGWPSAPDRIDFNFLYACRPTKRAKYQCISWKLHPELVIRRCWLAADCITAYRWFRRAICGLRRILCWPSMHWPNRMRWPATIVCTKCAMAFGWSYSTRIICGLQHAYHLRRLARLAANGHSSIKQ